MCSKYFEKRHDKGNGGGPNGLQGGGDASKIAESHFQCLGSGEKNKKKIAGGGGGGTICSLGGTPDFGLSKNAVKFAKPPTGGKKIGVWGELKLI